MVPNRRQPRLVAVDLSLLTLSSLSPLTLSSLSLLSLSSLSPVSLSSLSPLLSISPLSERVSHVRGYDRSGTTDLQHFQGLEVERQVQYEQVRIVQIAYGSNLT